MVRAFADGVKCLTRQGFHDEPWRMDDATRDGGTKIPYRHAAARAVLVRFLSASLPLLALALFLAHLLTPSRPGIVTLIVILFHGAATGCGIRPLVRLSP